MDEGLPPFLTDVIAKQHAVAFVVAMTGSRSKTQRAVNHRLAHAITNYGASAQDTRR